MSTLRLGEAFSFGFFRKTGRKSPVETLTYNELNDPLFELRSEAAAKLAPLVDSLMLINTPPKDVLYSTPWRNQWSRSVCILIKQAGIVEEDERLNLLPIVYDTGSQYALDVINTFSRDRKDLFRKPEPKVLPALELDGSPNLPAERASIAISGIAAALEQYPDMRFLAFSEQSVLDDVAVAGDVHGSFSGSPQAVDGLILRGAHRDSPRWSVVTAV